MRPYADTNFFSRLYLRIPESEQAVALIEAATAAKSSALPVTWLHRLETINAFELHVFVSKSANQTRVTPEQASIALATFRTDLADASFLRATHLDLQKLEKQFEDLALRHTAKHGFRTYDLLHVAAALVLNCDTFWSFDPKASKLAALEGFRMR